MVSPGMWISRAVFLMLTLPRSIVQRVFFVVSGGTVSPKAMSSPPLSISAKSTFAESSLRSMPWQWTWSFSRLPCMRRSPMKLEVLALRCLKVSSSTLTVPCSSGSICTLATRVPTSAMVSVTSFMESLGWSIRKSLTSRSRGKLSATRPTVMLSPVCSDA